MSSSKLSVPLDIGIAVILALASGILTVATYFAIVNETADPAKGAIEVPRATRTFRIVSSDGCAGGITTVADVEDSLTVLKLDGSFQFDLQHVVSTATVVGRLYFNPLGQMGLGYLALEVAGTRISADAKNVNPIQLILKVETQKPPNTQWLIEREHRIVIPGPLEMREIRGDKFLLSYPFLKNQLNSLPGIKLDSLGIALETATAGEPGCSPPVPLPLSQLAAVFLQQFPQVPGI